MNYPLVKKAYYVAHRDEINSMSPERCGETIHVEVTEGRDRARWLFYCKGVLEEEASYIDVRARRAKAADIYLYEGWKMCMGDIRHDIMRKEWKEETQKFVNNNPGRKVYIYNGKYGAYWRENRCGYTEERSQAGIYNIEEAWSCIQNIDISSHMELKLIND